MPNVTPVPAAVRHAERQLARVGTAWGLAVLNLRCRTVHRRRRAPAPVSRAPGFFGEVVDNAVTTMM